MYKSTGKWIYLFLVIIVLISSLLGIASSYFFQKLSIQTSSKNKISKYYQRFDSHINEQSGMMKSFLSFIKQNDALKKAFIDSNKQDLFDFSKKFYDLLNKNNDITHLYFLKPDGEVLLRVHDFKRDGDIVKRYTFLKSKELNDTFYGIEFGLKKNYTLRVVTPWIADGKVIGYLELGKEIDKIIDSISDYLGLEIIFAVNKNEYKNTPLFVQERIDSYIQTKNFYIAYNTIALNQEIIEKIERKTQYEWVTFDENHFILFKDTLKDVSDKNLGEALFLININNDYKILKDSLVYHIMLMGTGTFFVLLIGYFFANKKQQKLDSALLKLENEKIKAQTAYEEINGLLSLFDKGDSVLFKWNNDENWTIDYVSKNVEKLLGYSKKEFLSQEVVYADLIYKEDIQRVLNEVGSGVESQEGFFKHEPYRVVTKEGEIKWVLDYTVLNKDSKGNVKHFLGYIIDVTQREKIYQNLEKFIDTQDNIVILTDGKNMNFANKKFFSFLGFENIESFKIKHKCICEFFLQNNDRFFHLGKIAKDENWLEVMETLPHSQRIVSILGFDFIIHAFSVTVNKFDENLKIVSFSDITQTVLNHIRLEEKVIHDKLTGAYNREYFEKNYKYKISEFQSGDFHFALAMLDIDHFKKVNDTYGHDVGDKVLKQFVKTIQKYSRSEDILVRWGGEEFVMILKVRSNDDLKKALEHLRKVIELENFEVIGSKTCSIGATLYKDNEYIEQTLKRADEAVYEAKKTGRNKVVVY